MNNRECIPAVLPRLSSESGKDLIETSLPFHTPVIPLLYPKRNTDLIVLVSARFRYSIENDANKQSKEKYMNHIIIKIESGVVSEVYSSEPLNVTIVDHDVIEGGETFESRMKKAVLSMTPELRVRPENIDQVVKTLVLECRRPKDRHNTAVLGEMAA
jgi:hypothetical protein